MEKVLRQNIILHSVTNAQPLSAYVGTKNMHGNTFVQEGRHYSSLHHRLLNI